MRAKMKDRPARTNASIRLKYVHSITYPSSSQSMHAMFDACGYDSVPQINSSIGLPSLRIGSGRLAWS